MNFLPGWQAIAQTMESGAGPLEIRYVGRYPHNFAASAVVTTTIPIADLEYPADSRSLLVFYPFESPLVLSLLIDGEAAAVITSTTSMALYGLACSATADFDIVITNTNTSNEVGSILVFEVNNAQAIDKCMRGRTDISSSGTSLDYFLTIPDQCVAMVAGFNTSDTATHTINGGFTEVVDTDAGDYAVFGGLISSPQNGDQRIASTISGTLTFLNGCFAAPLAESVSGVVTGGVIHQSTYSTSTAGTRTLSSARFGINGKSDRKLVAFVVVEGDVTISSVTFGGSAMTRIGQAANTTAAPDLRVEAWAIDVVAGSPAGGDIVATFSSTASAAHGIFLYELYGVGSVGTAQAAQNNSATTTSNVDVSEGGCILSVMARANSGQTIPYTAGVTTNPALKVTSTTRVGAGERWLCSAETGRAVTVVSSGAGENVMLTIPFNP